MHKISKPYRMAAWLLLTPAAAHAASLGHSGLDLSANVALATDYTFRGISQTDENPAIQGGFDLKHTSGLYLGAWASNVDFNDGDQASIELDYYGGYARSFEPVGIDLGFIYYSYPGAASRLDYNYWEGYVKGSYQLGALSLDAGLDLSPDYFAGSGTAQHVHAGFAYSLPGPFSLAGSVGHQWIHDNVAFGTPDYTDWKLAVRAGWSNYQLELAYIDTDISRSDCSGGTDLCNPRAVVSVSGSF